MKKFIGVLVSLVIFIVLLCLLLPGYFSSRNKEYLAHVVDHFNRTVRGRMHAQIISEQTHWFCADAKIAVEVSPYVNAVPQPQLVFDVKTYFGPLMFYTLDGKWRMALGQTLSKFKLADAKAMTYLTHVPSIQGVIRVNFRGDYKITLNGQQLDLQDEDFKVAIAGLQGQIRLGDKLQASNGRFQIDQIAAATRLGDNLQLKGVNYTFQLRRVMPYIWSGTKTLTIPQISFASKGFAGTLNNVRLTTQMDNNPQFSNNKLSIEIPAITVGNRQADFNLNLQMNHVKTPELSETLKALQQLNQARNLSLALMDQYSTQLFTHGLNAFGGDSSASLNAKLNLQHMGSIELSSGFTNQQGQSQLYFMINESSQQGAVPGNLNANFDIQLKGLEQRTLGQLLHLAAQSNAHSQAFTALATPLIPALFTPESELRMALGFSGWRFGKTDLVNLHTYLVDYQPASMASLMQSLRLDVKWQVPISVINFLMNTDPNVVALLGQQQPDLVKWVVLGLQAFQDQFPTLLKEGYIVKSGELYVSQWNIKQNQFLINNQPLSKLLAEIQQEKAAAARNNTPSDQAPAVEDIPTLPAAQH